MSDAELIEDYIRILNEDNLTLTDFYSEESVRENLLRIAKSNPPLVYERLFLNVFPIWLEDYVILLMQHINPEQYVPVVEVYLQYWKYPPSPKRVVRGYYASSAYQNHRLTGKILISFVDTIYDSFGENCLSVFKYMKEMVHNQIRSKPSYTDLFQAALYQLDSSEYWIGHDSKFPKDRFDGILIAAGEFDLTKLPLTWLAHQCVKRSYDFKRSLLKDDWAKYTNYSRFLTRFHHLSH